MMAHVRERMPTSKKRKSGKYVVQSGRLATVSQNSYT